MTERTPDTRILPQFPALCRFAEAEARRAAKRCRWFHKWQRVTFQNAYGVEGRRCERCGKLQHYMPYLFRSWHNTRLIPNKDANGYY